MYKNQKTSKLMDFMLKNTCLDAYLKRVDDQLVVILLDFLKIFHLYMFLGFIRYRNFWEKKLPVVGLKINYGLLLNST